MKQFENFDSVIAFLEGYTNLEKQTNQYTTRNYRLDRMQNLLSHLGNPERCYATIHVAGSKGKGSTAMFIAKALTAQGEKTGLYLSPHLLDYRERFTLAGTFYSEKELVDAGQTLAKGVENFTFSDEWGETKPTSFELYTAFAFLLFAQSGCSWAIIETGLGGRLDATNAIIPKASVLCPIELEHTQILGDTIALIAGEKAKIIKPNIPVFISYQKTEAMDVFIAEAKEAQSPVFSLKDHVHAIHSKSTLQGEEVSIIWQDGSTTHLTLSMIGSVQAENAALALLVLKTLGKLSPSALTGIAEAKLPGRMERLESTPPIYLDGAHTARSIARLADSFTTLFSKEHTTLIFGAVEDKDHTHMIEAILPAFDTIIVTTPGTFKKSDPKRLFELIVSMAREKTVFFVAEPAQALSLARSLTPDDAAILVAGSFYLAGEIRKAFDQGY